jgi:hypothetical protein
MAAPSVLAGLPGSRIESSFSYYGMHDNPASSFSEVKIFIKNTIQEKAIQSKHTLIAVQRVMLFYLIVAQLN